jgi:hypothetical protein
MLTLACYSAHTSLYAQHLNMPADSVKKMLCKTWEINYVLMGAAKIVRSATAPDLVYAFRPDYTFIFNAGDPENRLTGKWIYDQKKKLIRLLPDKRIAGKNQVIVSLSSVEMIMLSNAKNTDPDNPENMKMVFRVRR